MKPQKGKTYIALQDIQDDAPLNTVYYKKGQVYQSDVDGCITDEEGDQHHRWDDEPCSLRTFSECFAPFRANGPEPGKFNYGDLLNALNKGGVKDLHNSAIFEHTSPFHDNWMMIIHVHEDDYKVVVQPQHLMGIDTPEPDEYIGLIRLTNDTGDDIDFNYWEPVLIMVDGVVTHISQTEFSFGGNGFYDPIDLDDCNNDLTSTRDEDDWDE